jgi:DNA-directed RNA polymerase specialized sigma24 family protein
MTEDDYEQRFATVYNRYFRAVLRYALAPVSTEQAKDVVAETFLIVRRRLGSPPPEPAAWLFGVARKVIAGHLRAACQLSMPLAWTLIVVGRCGGVMRQSGRTFSA